MNDIKDYKSTRKHEDSAAAYAAYLRDRFGRSLWAVSQFNILTCAIETTIDSCEPEPAIIPDRTNQNHPIIPDLGPTPSLGLVRKTVCQALTAKWSESWINLQHHSTDKTRRRRRWCWRRPLEQRGEQGHRLDNWAETARPCQGSF
jgi:hypothetical protein